jgi:triphosphoribosyl-dephospho-CoA synthetase
MNCLRHSYIENLAASLARGAAMELYLTPKPGLVDLADSGSHPDLSLEIMERSVGYITEYLEEIKNSLIANEPFDCQREIAVRAEQRLYENLGTNTHKGYIFLSGMLLIASWNSLSPDEDAVRTTLSTLSMTFFHRRDEHASNGHRVRQKYNAGGIVHESINGFPTLFEEAVPAFRRAVTKHGCLRAASFAMLARLMQTVEDTTTLHRAGPLGLSRVRRDGSRLEQMIARGENYIAWLEELNRDYIRMNLTIGGIADMVGLSYGFLLACGEIAETAVDSLSNDVEMAFDDGLRGDDYKDAPLSV